MDSLLRSAHALPVQEVERLLGTTPHGISMEEAQRRLERFGPNQIQKPKPPSIVGIFLHQFASPFIYLLMVAALVALLLGDLIDAAVIAGVLVINAVVGFFQEYNAERAV
ncbi:MAG: cation-transporting P-type ATPase [Bacteroidia bacterium]|nr:cation-transporting P-type ATPase [Bacteroidia bacterium]